MTIKSESLGSKEFKYDYNLKYAYVTGGMVHGIASRNMVVKISKAGMLGYFGTGGLKKDDIERAVESIQSELKNDQIFGLNLLSGDMENATIDICLNHNVRAIEASAYMEITPALVRYRLNGLRTAENGSVIINNKIMAKLSRPEIARLFLSPAPEKIVNKLLEDKKITLEMASLSKNIPMADDICVEADSGGHTDGGIASTLMPFMIRLRDNIMNLYKYTKKVRLGAAGGIGTPEAAAASFIMGADFILTGSINQCTAEAGTSNIVKSMLQDIEIQDTEYAPAGDMFEMGTKVQVLKKGVFFPARANKLYEIYKQHNSIDELDQKLKNQLQEKYFKKTFEDIYSECREYYSQEEIRQAEKNPKQKMAIIFRWYFGHSTRAAIKGIEEHKVDFQVHCGPALGSFNMWVKGTNLENWQNRHVDEIALKIMQGASEVLNQSFRYFSENN